MPNLKLFDVDTKVVYTLEVSEEDAAKANEGKINITYISVYL